MYWKWKSMIIDFSKLPQEPCSDYDHASKTEFVFFNLGIPDESIHSCTGVCSEEEYEALKCALELGLVEKVSDEK